jgi:hypothetical protein
VIQLPMSSSASQTLKVRQWGPQVVLRRLMVAQMNSGGVPMVMCASLGQAPRSCWSG